MTQLGSIITRIKTKFYYDENGNAKRVGNPDVAQIRIAETPKKAAEEAPGLTSEQVYHLKKHGHVTFIEKGELIRFEVQSAEDYEREYAAAIAKRDAE